MQTFCVKVLDKFAEREYYKNEDRETQTCGMGGEKMFPNLLGQKAARHLTDEDMAAIIGISRTAYQAKKKSGRFTAEECHKFCTYFGKSFEYLFAKDGDDYAS